MVAVVSLLMCAAAIVFGRKRWLRTAVALAGAAAGFAIGNAAVNAFMGKVLLAWMGLAVAVIYTLVAATMWRRLVRERSA